MAVRRRVPLAGVALGLAVWLALAALPRQTHADDGGGAGGGGGAGLISPLTRFDAQGRLPQSEAAARAVAKGGPVVAIAAKDAVLLVAPCKPPPPATVAAAGRLVEGGGLPKMWRLGKRTCLSHAGLSQDSRVLLLGAQQAALDHEARFGEGEEMALGEVAEAVATRQQEATMQGNKRPFGASILVAGLVPGPSAASSPSPTTTTTTTSSSSIDIDSTKHRHKQQRWVPRIYRTDPSGAYTLWRACAIGQVGGLDGKGDANAERAMALLEKRYEPGLSTRAALALALDCCRTLQQEQQQEQQQEPGSEQAKQEKNGDQGGKAPTRKQRGAEESKDKEGASEAAAEAAEASAPEAALDVAVITADGVRLVERLSPPEALLTLAPAAAAEEEQEKEQEKERAGATEEEEL